MWFSSIGLGTGTPPVHCTRSPCFGDSRQFNKTRARRVNDCVRLRSENHHAIVVRAATLFLTAALRLGAAANDASVCDVIDSLSSFRNRTATVRGEVVGSFRHGFFLVPIGQPEICPGWAEWGITRRAVLAIHFPLDSQRHLVIGGEFWQLQDLIRSGRSDLRVVASITGVVGSDRIVVTLRTLGGRWCGLLGSTWPEDSVPATLVVLRVDTWRISK
jgi:hypothetical protein